MVPYDVLVNPAALSDVTCVALASRPGYPLTREEVLALAAPLDRAALSVEAVERVPEGLRIARVRATARLLPRPGQEGDVDVWGIALDDGEILFGYRGWDLPYKVAAGGPGLTVPLVLTAVDGGTASA